MIFVALLCTLAKQLKCRKSKTRVRDREWKNNKLKRKCKIFLLFIQATSFFTLDAIDVFFSTWCHACAALNQDHSINTLFTYNVQLHYSAKYHTNVCMEICTCICNVRISVCVRKLDVVHHGPYVHYKHMFIFSYGSRTVHSTVKRCMIFG